MDIPELLIKLTRFVVEGEEIDVPLRSTCLASAEYDLESMTMTVRFNGGKEYEYPDTSPSTFYELVTASSAGAYFCTNIKE